MQPENDLNGKIRTHCVKSVQIRSFFWAVLSRIRNECGEIRSITPNARKYGPEKTPYLETFHTVTLHSNMLLSRDNLLDSYNWNIIGEDQ